MSCVVEESHIFLIVMMNVLRVANLTERGLLMHDWLELFYAQHYSQIVISAEVL